MIRGDCLDRSCEPGYGAIAAAICGVAGIGFAFIGLLPGLVIGIGCTIRLFELSRALWSTRLRPADICGYMPTVSDGVG